MKYKVATLGLTLNPSTTFIRMLGIIFLSHLDHKLARNFWLVKTLNTVREVSCPYRRELSVYNYWANKGRSCAYLPASVIFGSSGVLPEACEELLRSFAYL